MTGLLKPQQPVLAQRYRLIRQLDAGGMGVVWLAEALHLRSLVAVKIMDRALAATPEAVQRFLREAHTAASLRSPHVVQILDYGVHDSTPFIVMELLEGESLASRLKRDGRLSSWAQTELVVRHVARALGRAHDAGVIHRDLKPGNIFLVRDDEEEVVKLLDFGIAKTTLSPPGALLGSDTRTGEFLGSPAYASPEQVQGSKALDHRSDIWSLGVIAYECFLGRMPFASHSFVTLALAICKGPMPVPSEHGPVPAGFDGWFARACAREVEHRFQSAREASADLRRLVEAARGSDQALELSAPQAAALLAVECAPSEPKREGMLLAPQLATMPGAPRRESALSVEKTEDALAVPASRSVTAPMLLVASQRPPPCAPVHPPFARTDTVRLAAQSGGRAPRPRVTVVTTTLAFAAISALGFFTLGVSRSPVGVDGGQVATSDSSPSRLERADAPEQASDAPRPAATESGAAAALLVPPVRGESPSGVGLDRVSDEPASGTVASPSADLGLRAVDSTQALDTADRQHGAAAATPPRTLPPRRLVSPHPPSASRAAPSSSARLTITASAGSEILLDGVSLGTAPLESIRVEPGVHEVAIIQDGKRSAERLTIHSGEHKRVDARIDPPQGEGLNEAAVKRTIAAHRSAVLDTCWASAFGARTPGAPTSIRVPVTISVEPSGVVRSVVTTTEPSGYSVLGRCVEQRVAAWRFPGARAETVVNVAFVFVLE
jgi:serine/threonine protein kinase